jgi:hypothetical protein
MSSRTSLGEVWRSRIFLLESILRLPQSLRDFAMTRFGYQGSFYHRANIISDTDSRGSPHRGRILRREGSAPTAVMTGVMFVGARTAGDHYPGQKSIMTRPPDAQALIMSSRTSLSEVWRSRIFLLESILRLPQSLRDFAMTRFGYQRSFYHRENIISDTDSRGSPHRGRIIRREGSAPTKSWPIPGSRISRPTSH